MHCNEFSLWAHLCSCMDIKKLSTPRNATYRNQNVSLAGQHSLVPLVDKTAKVFTCCLVSFSFFHSLHFWGSLMFLYITNSSIFTGEQNFLINIPQLWCCQYGFPAAAVDNSTTLSILISHRIHVWVFQCGLACETVCDNVLMLLSSQNGCSNLHPAPNTEPIALEA